MRLPDPVRLTSEQRILYEHDLREMHSPAPGDAYHRTYMHRFDETLSEVSRRKPSGRVLDIACAQGNFSLTLAARGYDVVATDLRPGFLSYVQLKRESERVRCVAASLERLPFPDRSFDVVLLCEVLEHVAHPDRAVAEAARLLAAGGLLVATTPNGDRLWHRLPTFSAVRGLSELETKQFRPDADGHLFVLTRRELRALVADAGLQVVAQRVLGTPPLTGTMKARYLFGRVPVRARQLLNGWLERSPAGARLGETQLVCATRMTR